jgi:N6-adenosine-specific RNA methylase IME4
VTYRTIVVDPPWAYPGGVSAGGTPGKPVKVYELPYPSMTLGEIQALPVADLAATGGAWLFIWTTNRYLPSAFELLRAWGFRYRQTLVWHKLGPSPFGGTFAPNGAEFLLGASRGDPSLSGRWHAPSVITTSRPGAGSHSRKPEVWLDLIEACCPGPYLELFARRQRLGWDTWGNEALEHVQLGAVMPS